MGYPVIVIGMHRSGTGVVARMMHEYGIFMGNRLQRDYEPLFFLKSNKWILRVCHGAWDEAMVMHRLWGDQDQMRLTIQYLTRLVSSPRSIEFLGLERFFRNGGLYGYPEPWGWKDPRNTFTLPIWKTVFPDATIIHVYRHGVDVAQSLNRRQQANLSAWVRERAWAQRYAWLRPKRGGFSDSVRCSSLEGAFSLWLDYMHEAKAHVKNFGENALEVQYEALLEQPIEQLTRIVEFCELAVSGDRIKAISSCLNPARAFAYRDDEYLRDFASRRQGDLAKFGYG